MSTWFGRLPIRRKLIAMILATSATVAVFAGAAHLVTTYYSTRADVAADARAQVRVVLDNAYAAVKFDDRNTAIEILQTMQSSGSIRAACLYDERGELFAAHVMRDSAPCPEVPPATEETYYEGSRLFVTMLVNEDGRRGGTLHVRSDIAAVQQRLIDQAFIVAAVMLMALGLATLLSARLQALVSNPILDLSTTARSISAEGDYSIRAIRRSEDELGVLVDAFNGMLDRIQTREAELSRANEDLRREVLERKRAEQERADLLVREREANRLKDEFLATLSHELRTPLNAILGWTKLLRSSVLPAASVPQALEKVERNAQVQARLVEDLLEVSRITTGKLRLDIRAIDLVALATTAVESIRPAAEARGVTVDHAFPARSLPTAGDPDRLQQVIWNLLSNAVKFTPAEGRVRLSMQRLGDTDEIVVSDTGIGIDAAFLPNVFETFRQADASATRAHGGLGLGLAIVRNLVELHGGTVTAESAGEGQGATFTVRLPVRVQARVPDAGFPSEIRALSALSGSTIVVVDDDPDTRELLESTLAAAGARVHAAESADQGAELCRRERPDALVTDIGMPRRDGYSLVDEVKAHGGGPPRVLVALTAYAAPQDYRRSSDAGFHRHLAKPIDPEALVTVLRELLEATAPAAPA